MSFDRHDIWRIVGINFDGMKQAAREGYEPIANVYVHGREEPVVIGGVETRRDPDWPWVFFVTGERGEDPVEAHKEHKVVFVREELIARVEIAFRPLGGKKPIGFVHREDVEPNSTS